MKKESKAKKQEAERKLRENPVNEFTCCKSAMNATDFLKHLSEVHGITPPIEGKKSMLMHMYGDYWFSYNWQWELKSGLKFTQYTEMARDKDDPMRW